MAFAKRELRIAVDALCLGRYGSEMSTVAEIEAVLPKLTAEELMRVEKAVHNQFRQRGGGIIYDDSYGIETEADLVAAADEAFLTYDKAETGHAKRPAR